MWGEGRAGALRAGGTWGSSLRGPGRESCMVRHSPQSQSRRGIISPSSSGNTGLGRFGRKLSVVVQAAQRRRLHPGMVQLLPFREDEEAEAPRGHWGGPVH